MLSRQKVLLSLLKLVNRLVEPLEFMQWAFLLRNEFPSEGGSAFYDFVPYHCGPYSFTLAHEAGKMEAEGLLVATETTWEATNGDWPESLEPAVLRDLSTIVSKFKSVPPSQVLDEIYARSPEYAVLSKRRKLGQRATAELAVYTAGYEGLSVDAFLSGLIANGIHQLIDVRMNPIARRFGFHKSTLSRLCDDLGISYVHVPQLGIHSSLRQELNDQDDYEELFRQYRKSTLKSETEAIDTVAGLVQDKPSVLVCMEACPDQCHRKHLAKVVAEQTGLEIWHIEAEAVA
jgi:hypothetical protein